MSVLKGYIFCVLYAALCLAASMLLYKLGVSKKYTRKAVHILIGFEWVILNYFIGASYHLTVICISFLVLLLLTYNSKGMRMISSDGDNAPGTVFFCISMSVLSFASALFPRFMIPFGMAVFCTSLGDGFAGVVGQAFRRRNPKIWNNKTLLGTSASLILSFAVCCVFNAVYSLGLSPFSLVCIAAISALLELITRSGMDNITLPMGVSLLAYFLIYYPLPTVHYIVPIMLTPLLIAVVTEKKLLTPAGTVLAFILDLSVSAAFGNMGFLMMAVFLVGGTAIDKIKRKFRAECEKTEKKSDKTRDAYQVLANGLPAMILSVAYIVWGNLAFVTAFAAAVAEAFSDTCASGIGSLSKGAFDIFKMRKVEKGISGGMSVIGTVSALFGAAVAVLIPVLFGFYSVRLFSVALLAAFAGVLFDSFLGSAVQVKYRCPCCSRLTESRLHCGVPTKYAEGASPIDNDAVNLLSGIFSALLALALHFLFL